MGENKARAPWREGGTLYTEPHWVEHKVGERTLRFYPVSTGLLLRLRTMGKGLAQALTTLLSQAKGDQGYEETRFDDPRNPGAKVVFHAVTPEVRAARSKEREDAVGRLVEALTDERNLLVVFQMIVDSLREDFPRDMQETEVSNFLRETPLPRTVELVHGLIKANAEVLGPLRGRLSTLVGRAVTLAEAAVEGASDKVDDTTSSERTSVG